jgi:hypothetical protein
MQGPMAPEAQPATSRAQSNFRFRCYRTPLYLILDIYSRKIVGWEGAT